MILPKFSPPPPAQTQLLLLILSSTWLLKTLDLLRFHLSFSTSSLLSKSEPFPRVAKHVSVCQFQIISPKSLFVQSLSGWDPLAEFISSSRTTNWTREAISDNGNIEELYDFLGRRRPEKQGGKKKKSMRNVTFRPKRKSKTRLTQKVKRYESFALRRLLGLPAII